MLNERQGALVGYLATIAGDPKVRAATSLQTFVAAAMACIREDLPAVAAAMAKSAGKNILTNAATVAAPMVGPVVGKLLMQVAETLGTAIEEIGEKTPT